MKFEFSAGALIWKEINNERYFLFLIRDDNSYDLPKGHIEKNETPEMAALRETKEETGLNITLIPFFRHDEYWWFVADNEKVKKQNIFFLAKLEDEKQHIKISFEHSSYKWLKFDEALKVVKYKTYIDLLNVANDYINRINEINKLNDEYKNLPNRINDWKLSRNFVPGEGPLNAEIMLLGQAPGKNEDENRRPFIGMAGKLLDEILKKNKIKRDKVYITSIVQFFPPLNRAPTDEEINYCMPYLKRQIQIIKPKIIVLLGNIASKSVADVVNVFKNHGKIIESSEYNCKLFITIHPAAAVRIKKNISILEEDFKKLKNLIDQIDEDKNK
ncbi:MAG: uracil-DNA glycosylase family protein [Candidatus Micrarchaeia archaeon]